MRRPDANALRLATIVIVAFALLVSKTSVALAALLPDGDAARTVVLCTGTGLVRVTVSVDGAVVDAGADDGRHGVSDEAGLAHASHCDLVARPRGDVERRWATIGHGSERTVPVSDPVRRDAPVPTSRPPRDPPPRAPPVPA